MHDGNDANASGWAGARLARAKHVDDSDSSNSACSDDYSIRQPGCAGQNKCRRRTASLWPRLAVTQGSRDRPAAQRSRRKRQARGTAAASWIRGYRASAIAPSLQPFPARSLISKHMHAPRVALAPRPADSSLPNRVGDRSPCQPALSRALRLATHGCILAPLLPVRFGGRLCLRDFSPLSQHLVLPYNWGPVQGASSCCPSLLSPLSRFLRSLDSFSCALSVMAAKDYDAEKKAADAEPQSVSASDGETAEGTVSPLKRNLHGRHMQMIAIGRLRRRPARTRWSLTLLRWCHWCWSVCRYGWCSVLWWTWLAGMLSSVQALFLRNVTVALTVSSSSLISSSVSCFS